MNSRFPTSSRNDAYSLPGFREDYRRLSAPVQAAVADKIMDVLDSQGGPISHEAVKFLPGKGADGVWRIRVGERGDTVDHRIVFDVEPGGTILFLRVQHRDVVYEDPL